MFQTCTGTGLNFCSMHYNNLINAYYYIDFNLKLWYINMDSYTNSSNNCVDPSICCYYKLKKQFLLVGWDKSLMKLPAS